MCVYIQETFTSYSLIDLYFLLYVYKMGKISEFSIHFDPPQAVFYPGRPVSGYITLDLKKPMKMRGIHIKLSGKAYVHWKERGEKEKNRNKRSYTGKEAIITAVQCVYGELPGSGSEIYLHPAGKEIYLFSLTLPSQLPSSFESRHGFIRYILKAKVVKPWKFDRKAKCPITINELINTNHPMYAEGIHGEAYQEVLSFCCLGGVAEMKANIARSCYCPGETILLNTNVENGTYKNMHKLKAKLIQTVTYNAPGGSKTVTSEIAILNGPPIRKRKYERWENQPFNIPATPPTITTSKIISVDYKLEFLAGKPMSNYLFVEMQIVIGTIPYVANFRQFVENFTIQSEHGSRVESLALPSEYNFFDMPPSYSTVVGETSVNVRNENDKYTFGNMEYCPVYTFAQSNEQDYEQTSIL